MFTSQKGDQQNSRAVAANNHRSPIAQQAAVGAESNVPAQLPAVAGNVAQLKLTLGQTYEAIKVVNGFTTKTGQKARSTNLGDQYTANEHHQAKKRTEITERSSNDHVFIPTVSNLEDANNFKPLAPPLDNSTAMDVSADPSQIEYLDVFRDYTVPQTPQPNHIIQGGMGDCWLIGSMIAMANSPKWRAVLKGLITNSSTVDHFQVTISEFDISLGEGSPLKTITKSQISGFIPYVPKTISKVENEFLYAQFSLHMNELFSNDPFTAPIWPAILEKAFAEHLGGYQSLDDLQADHGLSALGGIRSSMRNLKTNQLDGPAWKQLHEDLFLKQAAITMTTKKNSEIGTLTKMYDGDGIDYDISSFDLVEDHVYAVINMSGTHVTLKNPHGHHDPPQLAMADVNKYFGRIDYLPGN